MNRSVGIIGCGNRMGLSLSFTPPKAILPVTKAAVAVIPPAAAATSIPPPASAPPVMNINPYIPPQPQFMQIPSGGGGGSASPDSGGGAALPAAIPEKEFPVVPVVIGSVVAIALIGSIIYAMK
jgi:hypothetical protein